MDFTGFYYSIAGCSATIVAIIGGFIASKLITISSERDNINESLIEINNKLDLKYRQAEDLEKDLNDDDALDYIKDNVDALFEGKCFEDVYNPSEQVRLEVTVLKSYWNKAYELLKEILECYDPTDLNSDNIPNNVAIKYNSGFEYDLCKILSNETKYRCRQPKPFSIDDIVVPNRYALQSSAAWYTKTQGELAEVTLQIQELELEKKQFEKRKDTVRKPKGMKSGLVIFAIFSLSGILLPLSCALFDTINIFYFSEWILPLVNLGLFVLGLITIFIYMALLLRWKDK